MDLVLSVVRYDYILQFVAAIKNYTLQNEFNSIQRVCTVELEWAFCLHMGKRVLPFVFDHECPGIGKKHTHTHTSNNEQQINSCRRKKKLFEEGEKQKRTEIVEGQFVDASFAVCVRVLVMR